MGSRKILMLVGSILIGALAGFALLNYIQGVEDDVLQDTARVDVWVVTQPVAAGTTAADVQLTGRLEQRQIESTFRPNNAVNDLAQIEGRIAVSNFAANQILVQGMFDDPEVVETTFADLIRADEVAISINVSPDRAVSGFINPGDFVDIIALGDPLPPAVGEEDAFDTAARQTPYQRPARFLYRGVRIIAVNGELVAAPGQRTDEDSVDVEDAANEALSLTIAVPSDSAQRILSVPESNLVLGLLPQNWTPSSQPNVVLDEILADADLPGENGNLVTPWGREGFEDLFGTDEQTDEEG